MSTDVSIRSVGGKIRAQTGGVVPVERHPVNAAGEAAGHQNEVTEACD